MTQPINSQPRRGAAPEISQTRSVWFVPPPPSVLKGRRPGPDMAKTITAPPSLRDGDFYTDISRHSVSG